MEKGQGIIVVLAAIVMFLIVVTVLVIFIGAIFSPENTTTSYFSLVDLWNKIIGVVQAANIKI